MTEIGTVNNYLSFDDPYFGDGDHDGDPQPGWYAAAERSGWNFTAPIWSAAAEAVFNVYLEVGVALARDDDKDAGEAAQVLAALPLPMLPRGADIPSEAYEAYTALRATLAERVETLADAKNLAARRLAFRDLSGALTRWARRYGAPAGELHLVFCPMAFNHAGAFWLQRSETVNNPYHGLEMPRCGWVVETIPE